MEQLKAISKKMTTLKTEILRPEAAMLLEALIASPELASFTLMGGTALALQIGHRTSLDFDFAKFDEKLDSRNIDAWHERMKLSEIPIQSMVSPNQISQFRINSGLNLLDFARDYLVNGVKVTFFAHGHNNMQRSFYKESLKLKLSESSRSFNMMGLEGLKVAKSLVLADRVRSRDLFDLYTLMSQFGWRIEDIIETATTLGTVDDPEYYLSVLTGEIPLDANDEGLEAVNMETTKEIENLYLYFKNNVSEYRQNLTVQWVSKNE